MPNFKLPGPLGFGGAPLGNMFETVDEATAEAALNAAWETGVRYFDTAPNYGAGLSEHRFGNVQYPRSDFVLSTKIGRLLVAGSDLRAPWCRHSIYAAILRASSCCRRGHPGSQAARQGQGQCAVNGGRRAQGSLG
ncbi:aldo/keto reductase [Mesorhizobium silamurunense]|uniref:aldo/keto reductase n=1 Tax=Mesorhizobium silamurunense TaxID=499528 RepID=UPI00177B0F6D|nr:aldo/keto reductase [Mesorhizobium silamurunense]